MKRWGPLITLALAMFIIVIDTTIMNVSISALVVDLNTTVSGVQAAISIYALVMAAFMLIGGKLADIGGQKRLFIIGLIIYSIGTTIASFSSSLGMLVVGWSFLEGLGAALMIPNIQTLLRGHYEGKDLAFAYGMISAVAAVGAAVGPIVGGFFTTFVSWRWAFRTELAIAIIVLILARSLQRDRLPERRPKFDFLGAILSVFGWSSIVLGVLLAQKYGIFLAKEPFVIGSLEIAPLGLSITPIMVGIGFLLIILLFGWEHRLEDRQADGLFRPSTFQISGIKGGFATRFLQTGITAGFLYIVPLLLQLSFEFTAMQTGVALMPFSLSLLILAIIGARLSARFFANRIIQVGWIIAAAGLASLAASIQPDAGPGDMALGALFGAGVGLIASQILNLVLSSVTERRTPETAGLTSTFEQLGNAIGVALIGTVMLGVLANVTQQEIAASSIFPDEDKQGLIEAVDEGIQLMSSSQLVAGLEEAGAEEVVVDELDEIYSVSRTAAFKAGVSVLIYGSLLGLVFSIWLPRRKLVVEEEPQQTAA
ncbi:MAG: MFS transporter [Candidatus Promineifilaceae bacterium]|nr:MFS transporter [Candidatus Promineifilaceae bacterium]